MFPRLFTPIAIGNRTARNRVMRLGTTTNTGANGVATERTVAFYRALASGGVGTVVTESMRVHPSNGGRDAALLLYRAETVPSLKPVVAAVRAEGALIVAQLNHGGRQHHADNPPTLWAPSAVACPHSGGIPHAMSAGEIADVVRGFATTAGHARDAGFDGVEIHGAQGHLIQEFLSPFSNRRDDAYGGSFERRLRFLREIASAVRERVGREFIVGYRMGVEEFTPGGLGIEDSERIAAQLVAWKVFDYFSLAQGTFNTLDAHLPDAHYPPAAFADLHGRIRAVAGGTPVIASARIQTPEQAEALLADGKADLVGLCRALIADPEWPNKARQSNSADIRRCISTSQCWGWIVGTRRLNCSINPVVGNEVDLPPLAPAAQRRKVVVVGGGPGGLEAARVAAGRGHAVVLFEKETTLGGKLRGTERFLPYHEVAHARDDLVRQLRKTDVQVRTGAAATAAQVLAEKPDAVIVATGAEAGLPELPSDGSVPLRVFESDIPDTLPPGDIVLMDEDGYYWAASVCEALARAGRTVHYVTRFLQPLRELPEVSRISTLRALDERGTGFRSNMFVERIERGAVVLRHYYNAAREERLEGIGMVVWIGVRHANAKLADDLRAGGAQVRVIGDAFAPRRLAEAIAEGHRAARAIE